MNLLAAVIEQKVGRSKRADGLAGHGISHALGTAGSRPYHDARAEAANRSLRGQSRPPPLHLHEMRPVPRQSETGVDRMGLKRLARKTRKRVAPDPPQEV